MPDLSRRAWPRRHRQLPLVVVGVLLVLGCALAFTDASLHLGSREEVLVVAQPVAAGQVLTAGDLRAARVSTGSGLDVVLADDESTRDRTPRRGASGGRVLVDRHRGRERAAGRLGIGRGGGRPEGWRLPAGPGPRGPGAGRPGHLLLGREQRHGDEREPGRGDVLAVEPASADSDSPTVFSLQVSTSDADEVASLAAAGQASLIEVGAGS